MSPQQKLQLVVLPGSNPPPDLAFHYERAFEHWHAVWSKTFADLEWRRTLQSDDFSRQDEILAIFEGERCIAMVCHRFADLAQSPVKHDSYFKVWTPEAIEKLGTYGNRLLIGNQISVDPDRRGLIDGISLKNLVTALTVRRVIEVQADAMPGIMRVDRNMNEFLYKCGAVPIVRNVIHHNVPVDLLAIHPAHHGTGLPDEWPALAGKFWNEKKGTGHFKTWGTDERSRKKAG